MGREFESLCQDHDRTEKLSKAMGGCIVQVAQVKPTQADLAELAKSTLAGLEAEFDTIFEERCRHFDEVAQRSEAALEEKRRRFVPQGPRGRRINYWVEMVA